MTTINDKIETKEHYSIIEKEAKRKNYKKPRKNRPVVIVDKQNDNYKIIFLTTSDTSMRQKFDLSQCQYYNCKKQFAWRKDSAVMLSQKKHIRFFLFNEQDIEYLMHFCGNCAEYYINNIIHTKDTKRCLMTF